MTRNKQCIGIPAGLCAALVFVLILTACPNPTNGSSGGGGGGGGNTPAEENAIALLNQLGTGNAERSGATVTLLQHVEIEPVPPSQSIRAAVKVGNLSIGEGVTLIVPAAITLTIKSGAGVTVQSTAVLKVTGAGSKVSVEGEVTAAESSAITVQAQGTIEVTTGGTVTAEANSVVAIESGGKIEVSGGAVIAEASSVVAIESGGKIEVKSGAVTANADSSITIADAGGLTVSGGTVVVAGGSGTVDTDKIVIPPGGGTVTDLGGQPVADVINGINEVTGTLATAVHMLAADHTTTGAVTIPAGAKLIIPVDVNLTLGHALTVNGSLEIANGATVTVNSHSHLPHSAAITNAGTIVYKADSTTDLTGAIGHVKNFGVHAGEAYVQLTEAFYGITTGPIVIDAGSADNTVPYTIKGLGKDSTALTVGILLANDNVTLDGVRIAITDASKAATSAITPQSGGTPYPATRYTAAVSIGRYNASAFLTGVNLASNNVTVQNSAISIDYSTDSNGSTYPFNAGIYICGDQTATPPTNITITGNIVSATGRGTNAAQGISIRYYDPSMVITNNSLTSKTGGMQTINAPAAGLFMNILPSTVTDTATPQITDNTLDGKNIDFYVNINSTGDYRGIPALFADKFGTKGSTWVTSGANTGSFYKKLYNSLMGQAKATGYAGLFFMSFGSPAGKWDGYCFAYEAWEKAGGVVTAVDYWGPKIQTGATVYDAQSKDIDANASAGGNTSYGTKGGYRGRITLTGSTPTYDIFHWNPTDTDSTYSQE